MALLSLLSGPQDPSQLEASLNTLITQLNGALSGSAPTNGITANTTGQPIARFGNITINTTTRATTSTGRYTISAPIAGASVVIKNLSTIKATITGLFERGKTKLTLSSTAALASANLPGVVLRGLSTSAWGIVSQTGKILTT